MEALNVNACNRNIHRSRSGTQMEGRLWRLALLVAAAATQAASAEEERHPWVAVWSVWSTCDCSGPANVEHAVPVCDPFTITPEAVQVDCSADGLNVTVRSFNDGTCGGAAVTNMTFPVNQCLPHTPASTAVAHNGMSKFQCVREHTPRAQSIVGKQYYGTTCTGDVISEASYVSGCFPSCKPPSPHHPLPNLLQVAVAEGLDGFYCNGTGTCGTGPHNAGCLHDGHLNPDECQVLEKSTSIKYTWHPG